MSLLPAAPRLARRLLLMAENYGESGPVSYTHLDVYKRQLLNLLPATVESWQALDAQMLLTLRLGEQRLLARITRYSFDQLGIHAGQALWAQIKSVSLLAP